MRALLLLLAPTVGFSFACAGIFDPLDTGGASGDASGGGSGVNQDASCAAYLDCLAAVDAGTLASVQSAYGTSGTCWSDQASADQCASACESGLADLNDANPDEPACADGSAATPADLEGTWVFTSEGGKDCDGSTVTLEQFDLELRPTGGAKLDGSATAAYGANGSVFETEVDFACTFADNALDCPKAKVDALEEWAVKGDYAGTIDGTVTLYAMDGNGNTVCTLRYPAEGVRD